MKQWLGKYRGTVEGPGPPNEPAGALFVNVPEVMGVTGRQLALPCFPYTGLASGTFIMPPPKAPVWVEFEGGLSTKPIWLGGFYPTPVGPPAAKAAAGLEAVVIETTLHNVLSITDGPTGIMLRSRSGATIIVNDAGIVLQDGKGGVLSMTGGVVSINPPNLVVIK